MIIRRIKEEEYGRALQLKAHAFTYGLSGKTGGTTVEKQAEEKAVAGTEEKWKYHWAAFMDDDKTMVSTMATIPFRINFDGQETKMAGIGDVSTLPAYRRFGGIRKCFEAALPALYEEGVVFSYLYPFSTSFYRKFGYELGCEKYRYKLKMANLPQEAVSGFCLLAEPESGLKEDIRQIDGAWRRRYNLMVIDEDYEWVDKAQPFHDVIYTYVYRNSQGEPKGYMTYRPVVEEGDRCLECDRFFFLDGESFFGLLGLLMSYKSDYSHIIFRLPVEIELGGFLPEWSLGGIEWRREQTGMLRVVHVRKALSLARMRGTGSLVLEITDDQIQQNNGRFAVEFCQGIVREVRRSEEKADIVLPIQEFGRLICGRYDMEALPYLPKVRLLCKTEKAAAVFYRKPMYITRYF